MVENIQHETPDVKTFRLVHQAGDIPFIHRPGQYMTLTLNINGQPVKRSYTIASAPTQRGHVELTIKRNPAGLVSRYMHDQVKVGDKVRLGAPAGKFFFDDLSSKAVVLIAGGVGITPVMSMLRNLTDRSWRGAIYFINAVRTENDRIYASELASLARRFENLRVLTCYSQSDPPASVAVSSPRWQEKSGYLNAADLVALVPNLAGVPIFLCGPESMMQAVRKIIAALGIPDDQISTEEFVSPKGNPATLEQPAGNTDKESAEEIQSATISFRHSHQSVNVDASATVLEAAEQAGVTLPWECRAGICGQCKVRCTSGRVRMYSRDALSKLEEASGFILACQACPVTESVSIEA